MKINRRYRLVIQQTGGNPDIVIEYKEDSGGIVQGGLTLEIDIERAIYSTAPKGRFIIYNLSPETRKKIFHDRLAIDIYRRVNLYAGYAEDKHLPLVFQGNIFQACSYRRGVNMITEIDAYSGLYDMINAKCDDLSLKAGYDNHDAMVNVIQKMNHLTLGTVDNVLTDNSRAWIGKPEGAWESLKELAGDMSKVDVFVDNEKIYVLKKQDYIARKQAEYLSQGIDIFVMEADTGVLETPRKYLTRLDVTTVFEPHLNIGDLVKLNTQDPIYHGIYAVIGISHKGVISASMSGRMASIVTLDAGPNPLGVQ